MATIAEFISYLSHLDQDATVHILHSYIRGYGTSTEYVDVDLDKYSDNLEYSEGSNRLYIGQED